MRKNCSRCLVEKPLEQFHRCSAKKDGRQNFCAACACERLALKRLLNPEQAKAEDRRKYYADRAGAQARSRAWKQANPEKVAARKRQYRDTHAAEIRASFQKWAAENRGKRTATQNARKANQLRATPAWANEFFIEEIYDLAARRTKCTGIQWHVDHIVPLRSPLVSGLHVEHNLRVIPAAENIAKGNRHWPGMP